MHPGSQAGFNRQNFYGYCDALAAEHSLFAGIIERYGYPPFWSREPSFETLIHIILEQQVSLASALAAFTKLKQALPVVTPALFLSLSDDDLKNCYFSRQKTGYARHLAACMLDGSLNLDELVLCSNETISSALQKVKGIGHWTANIFLMMSLHRADIFPSNDIALNSSIKHELQLPPHTSKEALLAIAADWKPYRTIAAYLLWHAYLSRKKPSI